ncbi:MAG: hypothetical protein ACK50Q_17540 [Labrys sp. (in: a-proteobacteria)]
MTRRIGFRTASAALVLAALVLAGLSAGGAFAQDGRYTLVPAGNAFLKLDTRTGIVSRCSEETGAMVCKLVPDDRDALQTEIDRLSARLQSNASGAGQAEKKVDGSALPSDAEVDRAFDLMDRAIRRFRDILREDAGPNADRT